MTAPILAAVCEGLLRKRGRFRPGKREAADIHPSATFRNDGLLTPQADSTRPSGCLTRSPCRRGRGLIAGSFEDSPRVTADLAKDSDVVNSIADQAAGLRKIAPHIARRNGMA